MNRRTRATRLLCVGTIAVVLLVSCGEPLQRNRGAGGLLSERPERPDYSEPAAHGDPYLFFPELRHLAATADILAIGRVVDERRSESAIKGSGEPDRDHGVTTRYITVEFDRVLYESPKASKHPLSARLELGDGMWEGVHPLWFNGVRWAEPGDRALVLLFLQKGCEGLEYTTLSDFGIFTYRGDRLNGFVLEQLWDPLLKKLARLSVSDLRARLLSAFADRNPKLRPEMPTIVCRGRNS